MATLAPTKVIPFLQQQHGQLFGASFVKKDGSVRRMVARLGVSKNVKGTGYSHTRDITRNNITVYEMAGGGRYRAIPIDRLIRVQVGGVSYQVVSP